MDKEKIDIKSLNVWFGKKHVIKEVNMRAIWKGHIRFSLVTIPIRIYSIEHANTENKPMKKIILTFSYLHYLFLEINQFLIKLSKLLRVYN